MSDGPGPGGLLVVDKPAGMTSHDVVARARRLLGTRRVGHAGTLDPMATGVLVLGVEWSTRLLTLATGHDKAYTATMRLGAATVTDDAEGEILTSTPACHLDEATIRAATAPLVGDILQAPSAVSAIKVDGVRSYTRVRDGEAADLPARPVRVRALDVRAVRHLPEVADGVVDVDVSCEVSAGTYVRALARDLGRALGVGGHLTALRRTRSGPFTVSEAVVLPEPTAPRGTTDPARADLAGRLLPPGRAAGRFLPVLQVGADVALRLSHGQRPSALGVGAPAVAVVGPDGDLVAVVDDSGARVRPVLVVPTPVRAGR